MAKLAWNTTGSKFTEGGVDMVALYVMSDQGVYGAGLAWNGVVSISENPSGADPTPLWANNVKYVTLYSAEQLAMAIEAYTYPDAFAKCDGTAEPEPGVYVAQQSRSGFGLVYRTKISSDTNPDAGYKLHLVYGCKASPSQKSNTTISDNPDAITFGWDISTDPIDLSALGLKASSLITIDSRKADTVLFEEFMDIVYGATATPSRLPLPGEVFNLLDPEFVPA